MKKIILLVVVAFLCLGFVWYFSHNSSHSPSITLLSPQGSENIEIGSEVAIRWSSENIPENYQIAINLHRVISDDELIEGQEFDPVLFVGLKNTGQINWKVLDHYPEGDYFINIVAYKSLPITENTVSSKNETAFHLHPPQPWLTYSGNLTYSLDYPDYLKIREFPDTNTGADFYLSEEDDGACITVATRDSVNQNNLSFEEYVRIAAQEEIQGFEEINSIEEISTTKGVVGYKTTWTYQPIGQTKQTSLPITYFPGTDSSHTIQISLNHPECSTVYKKMILTFTR